MLQSIRDSWRVFKSRIKRDHYYKYDNDEARWENRPTRVLDSHFKVLLQYWNDSTVQQISAKNVESRQQQDNMHTMGPVSFARKYYELKRMKEIEALQESRLSSSDEDPFDKVMKKEHLGRLRLYGRDVCTTSLK